MGLIIPYSRFPFDRLGALSGVERQIPNKIFLDRIYRIFFREQRSEIGGQ